MTLVTSPIDQAVRHPEQLGRREVELWRKGSGRPILLLHGVHDIHPSSPFVDALSRLGQVIAPTHPGFGGTHRDDDFTTMYDLVHHYRSILEDLEGDAVVLGFSFGGWIAAELAAAAAPMQRLVLVAPFGAKFGPRDRQDIAHVFNTAPAEMQRLAWSDPGARPPGIIGLGWPMMLEGIDDAELLRLQSSNDALSLYGWKPHMHNPQLKHWLHRIQVPTLVVWGEDDGVVTTQYGRHFADAIPNAVLEIIPKAGHHPELEQSEHFVARVQDFIMTNGRSHAA